MDRRVGEQITYLIASVGWRLEAELKAGSDLSVLAPEPWRILSLLHERNGRSMSELANDVLVEAPTLTKIIDRMIAEALVYRAPDPTDRRRVLIFVSERGSERWEASRPAHVALENAVAHRLGAENVALLRRLLGEIIALDPLRRQKPVADRLGGVEVSEAVQG